MSFVICVCGYDFSVMMGDGRLTKFPDTIVDEYCPKVLKINENVAVGFTGDPIPINEAFGELRKYNAENLTLERVKKILINKLKELPSNELGVKLIFSGRNRHNQFVLCTTSSDYYLFQEEYYPAENNIVYAFSGNNQQLCTLIVENNIANKSFTSMAELEEAMCQCITDVASVDNTVNTNILKVVIK